MENDLKILTPTGWSKFAGIVKKPKQYLTMLVCDDTTISATNDHKIYYNRFDSKPVSEYKVGDDIFVNDRVHKVIKIYPNYSKEEVYDIIDVEHGNKFWCNSVLVSNCQFMGESDTLIDSMKLKNLSNSVLSRKPIFQECGCNFYKEPEAGKKYIIGVDTCMGSSGDYAAIQIFEFPGFIQIGEWFSNTKDQNTQLETVKNLIQFIYNKTLSDSYIRPEIYWSVENNSSAEGFLCTLQERGGPLMYIPEATMISDDQSKRLGIATTNKSRPLACSKLKIYLESGEMTINSREFIRQLNFFINIGGKYQAKAGEHDDLITSAMVAILTYLKIKDKVDLVHESTSNDTEMPDIYMDNSFIFDFY